MSAALAHLQPQHGHVVHTARLVLRAVRTDDIAALHVMRCNPAVMQYMPGTETEPDPYKSYSVKRMELMMKPHMLSFAIELPATSDNSAAAGENALSSPSPVVVGFIGITAPPQLFYIFDERYWGRGYATEALQAYLDIYWKCYPEGLLETAPHDRDYLEAHVVGGNVGSEKVLKKCGFEYVREDKMTRPGEEKAVRVSRVMRPSLPA